MADQNKHDSRVFGPEVEGHVLGKYPLLLTPGCEVGYTQIIDIGTYIPLTDFNPINLNVLPLVSLRNKLS